MTAVKQTQFVSVEDYLASELRSDVRHEYLGGYVYAMAGARNQHNSIATALLGILHARLRGKPCQPFNSDTKVRIRLSTHTRFYYPDAMVVCEPNPSDDSFQDRPVVIAEVISDTTRRIDEGEKKDAYLAIPTLSVYLLIETDRPRIVAYRRTDTGFVSEVYDGRAATLVLAATGIELPLAELYERVMFDQAAET